MSGRTETPLELVLQALRGLRPNAYRPHPASCSAWDAHCPACGGHRALRITETNNGHVSLRCSSGCAADDLVGLLAGGAWEPDREQVGLALRHENTATWQHIAEELLRVAHDQQGLIAQLRAESVGRTQTCRPNGRPA